MSKDMKAAILISLAIVLSSGITEYMVRKDCRCAAVTKVGPRCCRNPHFVVRIDATQAPAHITPGR